MKSFCRVRTLCLIVFFTIVASSALPAATPELPTTRIAGGLSGLVTLDASDRGEAGQYTATGFVRTDSLETAVLASLVSNDTGMSQVTLYARPVTLKANVRGVLLSLVMTDVKAQSIATSIPDGKHVVVSLWQYHARTFYAPTPIADGEISGG